MNNSTKSPLSTKNDIDGKISDLSSKTIVELLELRDRQSKLLNNKSFIKKLPDKGDKIQILFNKINTYLKEKQDKEQACQLFEKLTLNEYDHESVQNVEWKGKFESNKQYLDSDDDSDPEDVMHILSQTTGQEKIVKVLLPEKPLITNDDLINIGEIPHVKYIVQKTEKESSHIHGHFKPYKTTKTNDHDPEKEKLRKKNKFWEVTAATPPPIVHGPAIVLTIAESLKLQQSHNAHIKKVEMQYAVEKLLNNKYKLKDVPLDVSKFGMYREANSENSEGSDVEGSDKDVHDEEPERGGVIFTVTN